MPGPAVASVIDARIGRILSDLRPAGRPAPESLSARLSQTATPGASLCVIDGWQIAWSRACGRRARDDATPVTPETRFQAASLSKPVFALAVLRLVAAGTLDLDADVNAYLTSWQVPAVAGWQPRVTLRQLLSHTAGTNLEHLIGYPAGGPWPTLVQALDGAPPANHPPVRVERLPGLQVQYSGGGTMIAQQAVVDRLGRPFAALMDALVLAPLGMTASSFAQPPDAAAELALGHPWNGVAIPGGWHVYPEQAAAGLWSTPTDLARVGLEMMRAATGRGSALGLPQALAAEMLRAQLADTPLDERAPGLGWFRSGDGARLMFGHRGWNEGYVSELRCYPATGQGAAVMLNANQGAPLRDEIMAALGRDYGWPDSAAPTAAATAPPECAGPYVDPHGRRVVVTVDAEAIVLEWPAQPPLRLHRIGDGYGTGALTLRVRFEAPAAMIITQNGTILRLTREARSLD